MISAFGIQPRRMAAAWWGFEPREVGGSIVKWLAKRDVYGKDVYLER